MYPFGINKGRFSCSFRYRNLRNTPTGLCSAETHFDISCLQSSVTSQFLYYTYLRPILFTMDQQHPAGESLLIIKDLRSHKHTEWVGLLWMSDKPFTRTVIFRTLITHIQSCPLWNSNPHSPTSERPQNNALDRAATVDRH